ncbi:MAG: hypothetical protein AAGE05_08630 [Pseudomonadota bacterium]
MALALTASPANAETGEDGVAGVSSVARASATILAPATVRTTELRGIGDDFGRFGRVAGLSVTPAAITRRDCNTDLGRERCNLIIVEMP